MAVRLRLVVIVYQMSMILICDCWFFTGNKKAGRAGLYGREARCAYLTCLPIKPASSNMVTWGLPKISLSLASALMLRLFLASCRLLALM